MFLDDGGENFGKSIRGETALEEAGDFDDLDVDAR